jgi:hypothetical protein
MSRRPEGAGRWPEQLPVGALRVGRSSARYEQAVRFYRDLVGLPVLESFKGSYGEDGTIFGLPDASVQLEIVRSTEPAVRTDRIDMLVFYLPDAAAQERLTARMAAAGVEPDVAAPLLGCERRGDLPGSGRARGRVRAMGLRTRPDLTEPRLGGSPARTRGPRRCGIGALSDAGAAAAP